MIDDKYLSLMIELMHRVLWHEYLHEPTHIRYTISQNLIVDFMFSLLYMLFLNKIVFPFNVLDSR